MKKLLAVLLSLIVCLGACAHAEIKTLDPDAIVSEPIEFSGFSFELPDGFLFGKELEDDDGTMARCYNYLDMEDYKLVPSALILSISDADGLDRFDPELVMQILIDKQAENPTHSFIQTDDSGCCVGYCQALIVDTDKMSVRDYVFGLADGRLVFCVIDFGDTDYMVYQGFLAQHIANSLKYIGD